MRTPETVGSHKTTHQVWQLIAGVQCSAEEEARIARCERRFSDAEHSKGAAAGARHALNVLEKAERGWYGFEQVAGELRYLAAMYRRHAGSGRSGNGYDLVCKAEVLGWASAVAARAFGNDRPFCVWSLRADAARAGAQ